MRGTRAFLISAALLGFASAASAADMPAKAPVYKAAPPVAYNWSGCYIGANAGWIRNDSNLNVQPTGRYQGLWPAPLLAYVTQDYSAKGSSGTAGGQIGCNWQSDRWVFGIEGDLNWTGIRDTTSVAYPQTPVLGGGAFAARNLTVSHELNWLSTVRGRLGYSFDRLLVFATGGVAFGEVKSSFFQIFPPTITDRGSASKTRVGWTAGGGLEYALAGNWTAKVEYLYVDLGSFSYNSPASDDPRYLWTTTVDTREHIVRAGINYRFGGPVVAKY